jgi:hypothetical protein
MHYSGYDNRGGSNRRSFLKSGALVASAGTVGAGLLARGLPASGEEKSGHLAPGDAAILRFLAAEIIETDLWMQYSEIGGVQDKEVPGIANGNPLYTVAL